jgi:predicted O-linked N-acetylglucosamine transferase (SPINDLY family)
MGVPVVAMLGNGISSRVAGAIASAIGLDDWVADDVEDYIALAVRFAAQPDALVRLRRELPPQIANAAAGNSVAYTRAVENAYRAMWKNYCLRKT